MNGVSFSAKFSAPCSCRYPSSNILHFTSIVWHGEICELLGYYLWTVFEVLWIKELGYPKIETKELKNLTKSCTCEIYYLWFRWWLKQGHWEGNFPTSHFYLPKEHLVIFVSWPNLHPTKHWLYHQCSLPPYAQKLLLSKLL